MASLQSPPPKATSDTGFCQEPFQLGNQYEDDIVLQNILKRIVPASVLQQFEPDLYRFGERVVKDILEMGNDVETPSNYPRLIQYDAWCRRVDKITTAHGWEQLNRIAAEEGLVGIAYERKYNEYSRIYQFAKQYLYSPSSAVHSCPISMSDGAARALELLGTEEMKNTFFKRLVSRDPNENWTSGQWMTERPGGSDVGRTETVAELVDEKTNTWNVTGFKWFSSATTADMTMLLARTIDPKTGKVRTGSKGLSLYIAEMRKPDGSLNGVRVHRLKDKFGTKGLPTAELELTGMKAHLVGEIGRGVPCIASILNITRVYAAVGVAAGLRRALAIAKDYALRREAFSRPLDQIPLHVTTLAQLELVYRATAQITFFVVALLGRTEVLPDSQTKQDRQLLRFLTPITKAYVCKIGVQSISEAMEALGGQGYMEEIGLGREYRNAQVNTIWEGTTNVLAMDVLRVLRQTRGEAYKLFEKVLLAKTTESLKKAKQLEAAAARVRHALVNIRVFISTQLETPLFDASARDLTFALGRVLAGALLIEQASWAVANSRPEAEQDIAVAVKWTHEPNFVREIKAKSAASISQEAKIVFGSSARL